MNYFEKLHFFNNQQKQTINKLIHTGINFTQILDDLIVLNKEHRAKYIEASKTMSSPKFAAQFCTVRCFAGRQIGSSTYINEHAKENDLIVVSKYEHKHNYFNNLNNKATILSYSELEQKTAGKIFNNIYVNEPTFLFNVIEDHKFYTLLARNPEQTFVLLGS